MRLQIEFCLIIKIFLEVTCFYDQNSAHILKLICTVQKKFLKWGSLWKLYDFNPGFHISKDYLTFWLEMNSFVLGLYNVPKKLISYTIFKTKKEEYSCSNIVHYLFIYFQLEVSHDDWTDVLPRRFHDFHQKSFHPGRKM